MCPEGTKAQATCLSFVREEWRFLCFMAADSVPEKLVCGLFFHQTTLPFSSLILQFKKKEMQFSISRKMKAWEKWPFLNFLSGKKINAFPSWNYTHLHSTSPGFGLERIEKSTFWQNYRESYEAKTVLGERSLNVLFLKGGTLHGSIEACRLTFGNNAELCALFSVRDKTSDLSELRCTFEPGARLNIHNFLKNWHTREQKEGRKCTGGPSCIKMTMIAK